MTYVWSFMQLKWNIVKACKDKKLKAKQKAVLILL